MLNISDNNYSGDDTEKSRYLKREKIYQNYKKKTAKLNESSDAFLQEQQENNDHKDEEFQEMILDGRQHFIKQFLAAQNLGLIQEEDFTWNKFCDGVLDTSYQRRGIESKFNNWDNVKEQIYLSQISKNKFRSNTDMYKKF